MFNAQTAEFYKNLVEKAVNYRKSNKIHRSDFFQLFLELYDANDLTFNQLTANLFIFVLAGYETTAATISYCLYEIAKNKNIHEKAQKEIDEILSGEISYEKILNLKFIENCLNETLRLYPVVPVLNRMSKYDYQIKGTDYIIPANTPITIPIFAMQRDEEIYENPATFDPNRFIDNSSLIAPFGMGGRACVGGRMAMVVAKLAISAILSKYNLEIVQPVNSNLTFSAKTIPLTPNERILMKFTHR